MQVVTVIHIFRQLGGEGTYKPGHVRQTAVNNQHIGQHHGNQPAHQCAGIYLAVVLPELAVAHGDAFRKVKKGYRNDNQYQVPTDFAVVDMGAEEKEEQYGQHQRVQQTIKPQKPEKLAPLDLVGRGFFEEGILKMLHHAQVAESLQHADIAESQSENGIVFR